MNKPIDQQSDCWSTEAFGSDSETHSEDGSNILRLASNQTSTFSINDPSSKLIVLLNIKFNLLVFLSTFFFD
jgi:hypothetical protein